MRKNTPVHEYQDFLAPLRRLAKASKAKLGGVSCFIIKHGAIISSGINHHPTGEPMEDLVDGKLVSRPGVIHAEIAALQAAAANGIDLKGAALLLNMSPCIPCAREIVRADIGEVCYLYEWWDKAGLDILRDSGITVRQLKEER